MTLWVFSNSGYSMILYYKVLGGGDDGSECSIFSYALNTFFASKWNFLPLFRFSYQKDRRKHVLICYFSIVKSGGELFKLFVSFFFSSLLLFSGKAHLIWDRLSASP